MYVYNTYMHAYIHTQKQNIRFHPSSKEHMRAHTYIYRDYGMHQTTRAHVTRIYVHACMYAVCLSVIDAVLIM